MKRKLKQFKKVGVLLLIMVFMVGCTDDLNITPNDDDTLLTEDAFEDESAYRSLLAGVYANLALTGTEGAENSNLAGIDAGTSQFGRVLLYMQTLAADQMIWSYENDAGTRELQRNIWTPQNPLILGMFSRTMASVSFANNFLRETTAEKLDGRNVSDATRQDIVAYRAEARLLRAMAYYYMMDLFGKAPFITENDPLNFTPPEVSRAELFTFIESELLDIQSDLVAAGQNEYGRADRGVANMILAKIYLNAEVYIGENRYPDCITQCEALLSSGYALADSYLHNFMADNNTNSATSEIIFPIVSDGLTTQNFGPTTVMVNGSVGSLETNGLVVGVTQGGWGGALRVRREFAELFADGIFSQDERNTLIEGVNVPNGVTIVTTPPTPPTPRPVDIVDISNRDTGFILQKYSNVSSDGTPGIDQTFVDTDFPLFRLADVYLMYAEAYLRGGGGSESTALGLLNELRDRANNDEVVESSDLTLDFILDERSRELHWEAHRRQDLIRFNRYTGGNYNWAWKGNGSNGIAIPAHFNVYPIPSLSLASNPELNQNTGY
ncbi:RagB/SusD family nutrient uptake outer membrane protein [Winogradskyella maritima]|uniref:RagB/SusD family nutrient uptake outer membrane protein n=1 Tax=Winogradskyella maritima TaxID=1517766 RepID=A0ABV8AJF4_9FLAO|nr:RagB/SusD family nutrient uptake outer membrane protein [Winogradskyella maritima]